MAKRKWLDPSTEKFVCAVPIALWNQLKQEADRLYTLRTKGKVNGNNHKINKVACAWMQKGLDHERDLLRAGFTGGTILGNVDLPPASAQPETVHVRNTVNPPVQDSQDPKTVSSTPICHGQPMLDYGDSWYCLFRNHTEPKG